MPVGGRSEVLELLYVAMIASDELVRLSQRDGHAALHAELVPVQLHLHEARRLATQGNL
ncbi:MAG: hypothetical protein JWN67_830 [Actinomycetia bacterium]|nr:hypothetical protein [Actinomycetes bacterium]